MLSKMANKKKLLLLNGSHSDIPLIKAAKELGFFVITTGNDPNLIGHKYGDEYHLADYSEKEKILTLAKKLKIDAICSCANDFGAISASFVAEQMGLPGHDPYETTLKLHQKDKFKQFALSHRIPTPLAKDYDNMDAALKNIDQQPFPVMIKPVDLTGGKGISKVETKEDYALAVRKAFEVSRAKRIVIEQFIKGTLHSFSTFIQNQQVAFDYSDNEFSYLNPYYVSYSAAPAINIDKVRDQLINISEKMASLLSLKDGVLHHQYLYADGKAYIVESTRRCSGDLYPYCVNYAADVDWAKWLIKAAAGMDCSNFPTLTQKGFCGRYCIMAPKNGIVKNVIIDEHLRGSIYDQIVWWQKGYVIERYLSQKLGVLLLKYDSMEEMMEKAHKLPNLIHVEMEPANIQDPALSQTSADEPAAIL